MRRPKSLPREMHARLFLSFAVSATAAGAAFGQTPPASEQAPPAEVIVTGSRIPAPNLESSSPIQVISQQEIQLGGRMDISDVISQLPQNFTNGLGQDLGNSTSGLTTAGGVATADLRGIGPNRTLVLVNGRRLGIGSPYTAIQSPAPDLDQIPTFLLERVDVVTGGASAVYGSDAIAGVINFVLKQDFEGFQVDYHLGQNWYRNDSDFTKQLQRETGYSTNSGSSHDGRNQTMNVIAGTNFADGAGNVTAYFGYYRQDAVPSSKRDFAGCQLNYDPATDSPYCFGSVNSNIFEVNGTNDYSVVGNEFVPYGTVASTPPAIFNSQPFIFLQRDDKRYTAGFMGHVDLTDVVKPYVEFSFMNDQSHQEVAPSALFAQSNVNDPSGNYNINCSNPFLSPQQQATIGCSDTDTSDDLAVPGSVTKNLLIGRRNVEGGGRSSDYRHSAYRAVGGLKGNLGNAWNYDAYGQYYYVEFFNSNDHYMSYNAIDRALLVTTDTAGNPVCVSGPPCVPYNIFADGGVTPEAVNYLSLSGTGSGSSTMRTLHADITGSLGEYGVKLPTANDGVGVNVGFEHRQEDLIFHPDSAEQSGDLAGFGSAAVPIDRAYSVSEEFIEARVPLVQDRPGVKDLVFSTGFRRSDYSLSGVANTHKFELQYAPTQDFRFRGTFQRAIRAPSLIEFFNPPTLSIITLQTDPCSPTTDANGVDTAAAATFEQCARTGVTAAQYGDGLATNTIPQGTGSQLAQVASGSSTLKPEVGNSYTFGVTFTPSFLPNFTGSLDYFQIKLKDEIGPFPAGTILNGCLETGDANLCNRIVRNTTSGGLSGPSLQTGGYIDQTAMNIASVQLKGVDAQGNYRLPLSDRLGDLTFQLNGSYLRSYETTPGPGVVTYDCAGLYGFICQTTNPKWRHMLRTSWETPWKLTLSAQWRYFGKVKLDQNEDNPTLHFKTFGQFNGFNARIPAYNWLDLAGSYQITDGVSVRAGINNVFDKNPPITTSEITAGGGGNTPGVYDQLGRQLFAAFTAKF